MLSARKYKRLSNSLNHCMQECVMCAEGQTPEIGGFHKRHRILYENKEDHKMKDYVL